MASRNFYLTTTLPYVNAEPHIGFALEIVAADVICRYQKMIGKNVIFNTGTDEHGQKIYEKALEHNMTPQAYTDMYAATFENLRQLLDLSYDHFIRTTNPDHKKAAQEFWNRCLANGDIYKKQYETKYCVGCELEKQNSDLVDGRCPLHPDKGLETREEENYFFAFSKYQATLLKLYSQSDSFVQPDSKLKEITAFVQGGLQDFSISRLKSKMPWGVSVPNDDDHVMYVWFDALVNYISTLGWPTENSEFSKFWPGIQVCGKDNLRQQAAMWQAMLFSAGVSPSQKILVNGFISVDGQKMSKSLGNVISPTEMVERYGVDGTRYLLMNLGPFGTDMDVSWQKFDTVFTAELSNGIGNLCSRVAKMCEKAGIKGATPSQKIPEQYISRIEVFDIKECINVIQDYINTADSYLSTEQPWKKTGAEQTEVLVHSVEKILTIAAMMLPFMPATAQMIIDHFTTPKIAALQPLFPRLTEK